MKNKRNYVVWFVSILAGTIISFSYVNPYDGHIVLSELVLQLSGSRGDLPLGFNAVEIVGFAMRLTPIWILEMFLGIELYQHFCTAGVFVFSRCTNRGRWYLREILSVGEKVFLFHMIFMTTVIVTTIARHDIEIDVAGILLYLYHILIFALWSMAMTVLVNILALKFGSSISFMVVMMIQAAEIALLWLGKMFKIGTPEQEMALIWNPMAHLVLGWQRSIFPQVVQQSVYENFYLEATLLLMLVVNVVVLTLGAVIIKRQELRVSDCEIGVM